MQDASHTRRSFVQFGAATVLAALGGCSTVDTRPSDGATGTTTTPSTTTISDPDAILPFVVHVVNGDDASHRLQLSLRHVVRPACRYSVTACDTPDRVTGVLDREFSVDAASDVKLWGVSVPLSDEVDVFEAAVDLPSGASVTATALGASGGVSGDAVDDFDHIIPDGVTAVVRVTVTDPAAPALTIDGEGDSTAPEVAAPQRT